MAWMESPIPAITPSPSAISPGMTEKSSPRNALIAPMAGRYTPAMSRSVEPEMPGSTIAVMATAPETKM